MILQQDLQWFLVVVTTPAQPYWWYYNSLFHSPLFTKLAPRLFTGTTTILTYDSTFRFLVVGPAPARPGPTYRGRWITYALQDRAPTRRCLPSYTCPDTTHSIIIPSNGCGWFLFNTLTTDDGSRLWCYRSVNHGSLVTVACSCDSAVFL